MFPLQALISLFVHLLQYPERSTADSDIDLMYTASGHLGYVEFASADLKFPFARDVTNMARMTVSKAKGQGGVVRSTMPFPQPDGRASAREEGHPGEPALNPDLPILDDVRVMTTLSPRMWKWLILSLTSL